MATSKLAPMTPAEQLCLHNRINLKPELIANDEAYEHSKGRNVSKKDKANIALHFNYVLKNLYRDLRNKRLERVI